jgi:hypothetical protein
VTGPGIVVPASGGEEAPAATQAGEAPKKFAGKYDTPEDLEKGYKELESKLGQPKASEPKPAGEAKPSTSAEPGLTLAKPPADPAPPKGFDLAKAQAEYAKDGKLSDQTYKSLAAVGFNKDMADSFIEGQKALAVQRVGKVAERVGGEENLKSLQAWATETLTETELESFNSLASSSDMNTVLLAYDGLRTRFAEAQGQDPNLIGGEGGQTGNNVFKSMTEITTAMDDPRYESDPAYRKAVTDKIARTDYSKLAR